MQLTTADVSQVIELAWQDDVPFEAICNQFELSEQDVIALMRRELKARSFRNWRIRVRARLAKHHKRSEAARVPSTATLHALEQQPGDDIPVAAFGDDAPARATLT
jgi:uncharacterized protein (TIGR03643 family)